MKNLVTSPKVVCLVLVFAITAKVNAQSELPEKYPSPAKVKVLDDFPKEGRNTKGGKGFSANMEMLPNGIKKVALVSFFAFDPGITKTWTNTSSSGYVSTTTTYTKKRSTGNISGEIAYGAFASSIEPMTAKFKELGIDLLLPHQFLDTDAKKTYYNSFQAKHEKLADRLRNMSGGDHDKMYGTLEGFNVIDIVDEPYANYEMNGMLAVRKTKVADNNVFSFNKDTKMTESIGYELCTTLGVDAVLVSYMTVFMPSKTKIQLVNVRFVMFGPNPVMPAESKGGMIPHVKGQFYCGYSVNPDALIYNENKKDPKSKELNFEGFSNIYVAMVKEMGEYIKPK
jgi:hypothetical protein